MRRAAQRNRLRNATLSAPLGGVNTVDAGPAMPPTDCVAAYNFIPAELGLRSRLGHREHALNIGAVAGPVPTLLPFTGSKKDGSLDRLFACAKDGIYNVTASTDAPTRVHEFATKDDDSGWGTASVLVTIGGHFLLYADEAAGNGLHIYSESANLWWQAAETATAAWAPLTAYALGDRRLNGGNTYVCTVAGVSAGAGGPAGTGIAIVDGAATWRYAPGITGIDPRNVAFVTVWKNRVWLVMRESADAYYLDVGVFAGAASRFAFGNKFQAGGQLAGLWNWTIDGGSGMDDHLVAISTAGDVLVYQGSDPASASSFSLQGSWFVGAVPAGRRIASSFGGDVLILSLLGILPLRALISGGDLTEPSLYTTGKIRNQFALDAAARKAERAWGLCLHPEDNTLVVLMPDIGATTSRQWAMSIGRKSWWPYRGLPMLCAETWKGKLYFGTSDGRVCINDGYSDDVPYGGGSGSEIEWALLGSFQEPAGGRLVQVQFIKPQLLTQGAPPAYECQARYEFDLGEIASAPAASVQGGGAVWDAANWDAAVWGGGEYVPESRVGGATGIGSSVAVAIRGSSAARVILVGIKVSWEESGRAF